MVVRLRLSRQGPKNSPFYHLVAIRNAARRDARPIEKLGEYDPVPKVVANPATGSQSSFSERPHGTPHPAQDGRTGLFTSGIASARNAKLEKRMEWNRQRIAYWLEVGAQPTETVARLLFRAGVVDEHGVVRRGTEPIAALSREESDRQVRVLEDEAESVRASKTPGSKTKLPAILQLIEETKNKAAARIANVTSGQATSSSTSKRSSRPLPPSQLTNSEFSQQDPDMFRPDQNITPDEGREKRAPRLPLALSPTGRIVRNKRTGTHPHRPQLPLKSSRTSETSGS